MQPPAIAFRTTYAANKIQQNSNDKPHGLSRTPSTTTYRKDPKLTPPKTQVYNYYQTRFLQQDFHPFYYQTCIFKDSNSKQTAKTYRSLHLTSKSKHNQHRKTTEQQPKKTSKTDLTAIRTISEFFCLFKRQDNCKYLAANHGFVRQPL